MTSIGAYSKFKVFWRVRNLNFRLLFALGKHFKSPTQPTKFNINFISVIESKTGYVKM